MIFLIHSQALCDSAIGSLPNFLVRILPSLSSMRHFQNEKRIARRPGGLGAYILTRVCSCEDLTTISHSQEDHPDQIQRLRNICLLWNILSTPLLRLLSICPEQIRLYFSLSY